MDLIERLIEDYNEFGLKQDIRIEDLNMMGYLVSDRQLILGDPAIWEIGEIIDADKNRVMSFCYLYCVKKNTGFIMPKSFDYYADYSRRNRQLIEPKKPAFKEKENERD